MSIARGIVLGAGVLGLATVMARPASAVPGFEVRLTDLTTPATTSFFAPGTTTIPVSGINFGGYSFGLQLDSNYPGAAPVGTLSTQLTFTGSAVGANHHITVEVFVADSSAPGTPVAFSAPIGPIAVLSGSTSVSFNATLSAIAYAGTDSVTTPGGPTTTLLVTGPVTTGSSSANSSVGISGGIGTTYTLSNFLDVISLTAASSLSGIVLQNTTSVTASVPEPATMAILGTGIAVLGVARRRKR